jgi:DNA-binding NarL/FixJ family response regulator
MQGDKSRSADSATIVFAGDLPGKWAKVLVSLGAHRGTMVLAAESQPGEVLEQCRRLAPCVFVTSERFVDSVDRKYLAAALGTDREIAVLVQVEREDLEATWKLIQAGCMGVLSRDTPVRLVKRAITKVAAGELWVSRLTMSCLLNRLLQRDRDRLTEREGEILALIGQGLKNEQIASRLYISPQTVRWHLRSVYGKLGVRDGSRTRLQALELRRRLAPPTHEETSASSSPTQE